METVQGCIWQTWTMQMTWRRLAASSASWKALLLSAALTLGITPLLILSTRGEKQSLGRTCYPPTKITRRHFFKKTFSPSLLTLTESLSRTTLSSLAREITQIGFFSLQWSSTMFHLKRLQRQSQG